MGHGSTHQRRYRRWWVPLVLIGAALLAVAAWGIQAHRLRLPEAEPAPVPAGPPEMAAPGAAVGNVKRYRRWWVPPVLIGAALLAVAAWGIQAHRPRLPEAGPPPVLAGPPEMAVPAQVPAAATGSVKMHGQVPARAVLPMPAVLPVGADSVKIPSLDVTAAATPESVDAAGALGVPPDPAKVGWWMPSTAELVIDGHVDMARVGPGALFRVRALRPGAAVVVTTVSGTERWKVDGVRTYQKGHVPAGLFNGQGPRLVIVTCGGPFDDATHHYEDNVIAYASWSGGESGATAWQP
jgi:hypothetical protein